MKFFLNWIDLQQPLRLEEIEKTDLDILDFTLTQREGEIALCQITTPLNTKLLQNQYALLFVEKEGKRIPLLKGKLMELPVQINDWHQRIEFFAMPIDAQEQLQAIREQTQKTADWDELFVDEHLREDPVEVLEAIPSLFCWHPVTHKLTISDIFKGTSQRKYDETQILRNSFSIKIANLPKPYINISLIAEWIQEAQGEFNLFPLIEKRFESGKINTLTARGISSSWPTTGQMLGRSGYAVVKSSLIPFVPKNTGILGLYPQMTSKITFKDEAEKSIYLKRSWFTGSLKIDWHYRQRRREIVNFRLFHQNQLMHRTETKKLHLTLRLADISKDLSAPSTASFFDTDRGKKAVAHALKIARCHLALSARGIEIAFKIPLAEALSLSMDESVQVYHHALPQGQATGKLISYKIFASFEAMWAELKVAIATGKEETELPASINLIAENELAGLPEVEKLTFQDFIETIEVNNQASDQIKLIQQTPLQNIAELNQLLSQHQTEVNVKLKDIRSTDVLERRFSVENQIAWSAPCQIKFGEEK